MTEEATLAADSVIAHLVSRGVLLEPATDTEAKLRELGGGVSSVVVLVETGKTRLVVKQPRRQLLVKDEWLSDPERALIEAQALQFAGRLTPTAVPTLVDVDAMSYTVTMTAAPPSWRSWKEILLEGVVDPSAGARLGSLLGNWHRTSSQARTQLQAFADLAIFEQLRVEPFHRTVAARHPDLAPLIAPAIEDLTSRPGRCLVHGDFSPKNVLVGDGELWVIDFEVAHLGDPVFDLAFLVTHLILKSIHRPDRSAAYRAAAMQFLESYKREAGAELAPPDESLARHVGCVVLARVDGKSPAEYLTPEERKCAWAVGLDLLRHQIHPTSASAWPKGPVPL